MICQSLGLHDLPSFYLHDLPHLMFTQTSGSCAMQEAAHYTRTGQHVQCWTDTFQNSQQDAVHVFQVYSVHGIRPCSY
jgi:hypothetical protein